MDSSTQAQPNNAEQILVHNIVPSSNHNRGGQRHVSTDSAVVVAMATAAAVVADRKTNDDNQNDSACDTEQTPFTTSSSVNNGSSFIILATKQSADYAQDLSNTLRSQSPSPKVVTVLIPNARSNRNENIYSPLSAHANPRLNNTEPKSSSDTVADPSSLSPKLLYSASKHPRSPTQVQSTSSTSQVSNDGIRIQRTDDIQPESNIATASSSQQDLSLVNIGEDAKNQLSNTNSMPYKKRVLTLPPPDEYHDSTHSSKKPISPTPTVRFNRKATKTTSADTEDTSPSRHIISENSFLSRLKSRRTSRARPIISRTRSRFATLLVLPDRRRSRRGRLTIEALPNRVVLDENGDEVEDNEERMERPGLAVRAQSTNERESRYERRGRSLFRGIGSGFSSSASGRRRAKSPVRSRGRNGINMFFRRVRMTSVSPEPHSRNKTYRENKISSSHDGSENINDSNISSITSKIKQRKERRRQGRARGKIAFVTTNERTSTEVSEEQT